MIRRYEALRVRPETRRLAKTQASIEGEKLIDWIDKVVREKTLKKKRRDDDFSFF